MSDYTEADEADVLEQSTAILSNDEDPDEEYPNALEQEQQEESDAPEELDDVEIGEPEDPGLSEG